MSFEATISYHLLQMRTTFVNAIKQQIEDRPRRVSESQIDKTISEVIDHYHMYWGKYKDRYPESETKEYETALRAKYHDSIEKVRDRVFEQLPLSDENRRKIEEFCYFLVTKENLTRFYTGVVFTGFGDDDLFPRCIEYKVENLLCGRLKYQSRPPIEIGATSNIATIIPFAQRDVISNFMEGIHPRLEQQLEGRTSQ